MTDHKTSLAEQETIIRWDRATPTVYIFSAAPPVIRRLKRLFGEPVKVTQWGHAFFQVPLQALAWGRKRRGVPGNLPRRLQEARL